MKTKKPSAKAGTNQVQQLFVFTVFASFTLALAQQLWLALSQLSSNPNLSSFYLTFISISLMPLVTFVASYLLIRRKISLQQKLFESTLVGVIGYTACMGLNVLINTIVWSFEIQYNNLFASFGVPTVITLAVFGFALFYVLTLRKSGRW